MSSPEGNASQLKSHGKRKQDADDPPNNVTYTRRKALTACNVCRARKTRCDNVLPKCGFCRSVDGECSYTQPSRSQWVLGSWRGSEQG